MDRPLIEARDLRFTYPGAGEPAVDGIDFDLAGGEILGFLGPNGAGKSTTQRILVRLLRGFEGRIAVAGRELAQWNDDLYEQIGVQFEFPNHHLKLTGRENLAFFAGLYSGPVMPPGELLERVGLSAAADRRVATYSKGMRVRLALARALLHRPRLLFLDEPTGGLDPVTNREIRALIHEQRARGAGVFLTTHDMVVADDLCDRVAFIVQGRLPRTGAPRQLRREFGTRTVRLETRLGGEIRAEEYPLEELGRNERFLRALGEGEVEALHTQETTLEDVFVQITGERLQ